MNEDIVPELDLGIEPKFNPRIFDSLIGGPITQDSVVAISELVANAWDAGSTSVEIVWPDEFPGEFYIQDDGHGMSSNDFLGRFTDIGYNRRDSQGGTVSVGKGGSVRKVFGRNGLGRFAGFHFANRFIVQTSADGLEFSTFELRRSESATGLSVEPLADYPKRFEGTGTLVFAEVSEAIPRTSAAIRKELGLRFLSDPEFVVNLNHQLVDFDDIPEEQAVRLLAKTAAGHDIEILAIDTKTPDSTTRLHGVAWHVDKKLVGACRWKGPNNEPLLDGRTMVAKRHTFIVKVEHLASIVTADWQGFQFK